MAWVILALLDGRMGSREPLARALARHFHEVPIADLPDWRRYFAISSRSIPMNLRILQSKRTFPYGGSVDFNSAFYQAMSHVKDSLGPHASDPVAQAADFQLCHSLKKSDSYTLPVSLARYAAMFYLSSLVRYKPSALDPYRQGAQAWLMDSFSREVPLYLLSGALSGISDRTVAFEPSGFRT
ncbi:hypothetical protein ASD18_05675 [Cellulomonas sp. Root137]|nr:hypothetical protein ASD18_05675 [Cellulomonas sp. Root137]